MIRPPNIFFPVLIVACVNSFAHPPSACYALAWSDEFNGTALDTSIWTYDTGCINGSSSIPEAYYSKNNIFLDSGALVIEARRQTSGAPGCSNGYSSGRINTRGKISFLYGYLEARLKAPHGNGLWPSFYTIGENIATVGWPACGGMGMYEQLTGTWPVAGSIGDKVFSGTCDFMDTGGASHNSKQLVRPQGLDLDYHLYGILWDSAFVEYYFDDSMYWSRTETPNINAADNFGAFHQGHFLNADITVGGPSVLAAVGQIDDSIFPQRMCIDFVRVYQKAMICSLGVALRNVKITLVKPASATLRVYDLKGKMIADLSSWVRTARAGADVLAKVRGMLHKGAYVVRLSEGARVVTQKVVSMN